jgi:hypothetical protein
MPQTIDDPLGIRHAQEADKRLKKLMSFFSPENEVEKILVEQFHWHTRCNDPRATKLALGSLLKMLQLRKCTTDCQKQRIVEDF